MEGGLDFGSLFDQMGLPVWVLIAGGGLLVVVGAIKIISKGISLMLWLLLVMLGVAGVTHGLAKQNIHLPVNLPEQVLDAMAPNGDLTAESIATFCAQYQNMMDGEGFSLQELPPSGAVPHGGTPGFGSSASER